MAHSLELIKPSKSQLQAWADLSHSRERRGQGLFLAEGYKIIQELYRSHWEVKAFLVMGRKKDRWEPFLFTVITDETVFGLTDAQWGKLSQDRESEGLMAVVERPPRENVATALSRKPERLLLLHQVNNPNNLGALLRTAQWFGFGTILLGAGSVDFTNPKVVRSSMGSIFHVRIVDEVAFDEAMPLIKRDYFVLGSHARKGARPHVRAGGKTALFLGSESHGIPKSLLAACDELWRIPGVGDADSLSLPQAAAIMMYECASLPDNV
ncbi:MAG: RNA methyltransferase [Deltaproteobacteria bacterium]|nr:RNA methyltransferase [Deltaproteobacteria bacterium]